jgi:dienelactone hydrolase
MRTKLTSQPYVNYGIKFDGALITGGEDPRPGVLVIHGWEGRSVSQERFATRLAELGYAAFCVDLYGEGRRGTTPETCQALMEPLMADRGMLRRLLIGAVEAAAALDAINSDRMAAIGFCFGGLCVLDLARANAPLRGVVSFHGVLTAPNLPASTSIDVPILILHGWDDPMAKPADVLGLGTELSAANADWQVHAYGKTMHAFMAEGVDYPALGLQYNERSAQRAWRAMANFLADVLADGK